MNLEQFKNVAESIQNGMFSDSVTKDKYNEVVKNRLTYQNSVEKLANGGSVYVPNYSTDVVNTAGIRLNDGFAFINNDISDSLIVAQNNQHANQIVKMFNDDAYSATSQGTPSYLTTIWTTRQFEVITRATVFDKISHPFQQGTFGITNIKIPTVSYTSNYSLYSDYGVQGDSGINVNWADRQVVDFERMMIYGDKAVAQMSMGKIDYINQQREGMMRQIKLHQDALGFFGYSANMAIYGLLNDPSLQPTITAGIKATAPSTAPTLWIYGTYYEIYADIQKLYVTIQTRAGGHLGFDEKCYLLVPPAVYGYLLTVSTYSINVLETVSKSFKGMEIIQAPLLQGTAAGDLPIGSAVANQAVLIFDTIEGQPCLLNSYVTLFNSHGTVRQASSFQEKVSYSLGGAIVSNGIGIQIMQGV